MRCSGMVIDSHDNAGLGTNCNSQIARNFSAGQAVTSRKPDVRVDFATILIRELVLDILFEGVSLRVRYTVSFEVHGISG